MFNNQLDQKEIVTRYLTSKKHFSINKNIVKPWAFMPPPSYMLSVFRIKDLDEPEIWKVGFEQVINNMPETKSLHGRADISVSNIFETDLMVDPDDIPPRHANIVGWPKEKEKCKSIAQELAAKASLRLNNK